MRGCNAGGVHWVRPNCSLPYSPGLRPTLGLHRAHYFVGSPPPKKTPCGVAVLGGSQEGKWLIILAVPKGTQRGHKIKVAILPSCAGCLKNRAGVRCQRRGRTESNELETPSQSTVLHGHHHFHFKGSGNRICPEMVPEYWLCFNIWLLYTCQEISGSHQKLVYCDQTPR